MKKIKKICAIFLAAICGLMVGCRPINDIKEELENSSSAVGGKVGLEILRCFNEYDSESLKEMYSTFIKNTHDLDSEIEEAFTVIDGEIVSYDNFIIGGEKNRLEGEPVYSDVSCTIPVKTSNDENFDICIFYIAVCKNENKIGLKMVSIFKEDELICTIGERKPIT